MQNSCLHVAQGWTAAGDTDPQGSTRAEMQITCKSVASGTTGSFVRFCLLLGCLCELTQQMHGIYYLEQTSTTSKHTALRYCFFKTCWDSEDSKCSQLKTPARNLLAFLAGSRQWLNVLYSQDTSKGCNGTLTNYPICSFFYLPYWKHI